MYDLKGKQRWLQHVTICQYSRVSNWTDWRREEAIWRHFDKDHGDASAIVINTLEPSLTWVSSCRSGFNKCCWIMLPCAWLLLSPQLHTANMQTIYVSDNNVRLSKQEYCHWIKPSVIIREVLWYISVSNSDVGSCVQRNFFILWLKKAQWPMNFFCWMLISWYQAVVIIRFCLITVLYSVTVL